MDKMRQQLDIMKSMLEELLVQKPRKTFSRASTFEVEDDDFDESDSTFTKRSRENETSKLSLVSSSLRRISE